MKRSRRRIARLITYRERLERLAERSFAEAQRASLLRAEQLRMTRAARDALLREGGAPATGPVELELLVTGQAHGRYLLRLADAQAAALAHAQEEERRQLALLLDRRRERRAVELLLERRRALWLRQERRRAIEQLDEFASVRWWRTRPEPDQGDV